MLPHSLFDHLLIPDAEVAEEHNLAGSRADIVKEQAAGGADNYFSYMVGNGSRASKKVVNACHRHGQLGGCCPNVTSRTLWARQRQGTGGDFNFAHTCPKSPICFRC